MLRKKGAIVGAILLGLGIGAFPLLTAPSSTPASVLAESAQPAVAIEPARVDLSVNGIDEEQSALLVNDAAYVPVRMLERLGGNVGWDEQARKVMVNMEP